MIFTVVGMAMVGIMMMASNLFRNGEYSRAATDEAVAVIAAIDDDLNHMVPASSGGYLDAATFDPAGNCLFAFKIERKDRSQITSTGQQARQIVVWWVAIGSDGVAELRRGETTAADSDANVADTDEHAKIQQAMFGDPANGTANWVVITRDCLHFGVWLSSDIERRDLLKNWTGGSGGETPPLASGGEFIAPTGTQPFPSAVRVTLVLTGGGRFAPRGTLARDIDNSEKTIRLAGAGAVSTAPGAMLRIEDEWIGYTNYQNGAITIDTGTAYAGRGLRRSYAKAHNRGVPIRFGQAFSLVRPLPR